MPRNWDKKKRHEPKPDVKYSSVMLSKFINGLMHGGKKSTAERAVYKALGLIGQKLKDVGPLEVFEGAVKNVKPLVEVKSRRVGGATYQVPVEVSPRRQVSLGMRWIRDAARGRKGKPMYQCLAAELIDAYHREGAAMTVRENTHRMAEANKAFAHFAW
jgi:small subunit ribosomal protein S7